MSEDAPLICNYAEIDKWFTYMLRLDKIHLVGHSVGIVLASGLHQAHGAQLLSLTLAETFICNDSQPRKSMTAIVARARDYAKLEPADVGLNKPPNSLSPTAEPATVL